MSPKNQFLRLCTIATLLCITTAICPKVSAQGEIRQNDPEEPGVVSYTFRNQFSDDAEGTLETIKEMGFTHIELSSLFGKSAEEMKNLLDEHFLICTSYGIGYNDLLENPDRAAEEANTLGARFVRVAWIPHEEPFTKEDADRAIRDFETAGKVLNEHGLQLLYHNHGYEFRPHDGKTLFDYLVQNSNPKYLNFQMDTFWVAHPGFDPVELLNRYPQRFYLVHLKDLAIEAELGFSGNTPPDYDVPLGEGQVDFEGVMEAAEKSNIRHFYVEDETEDVLRRVPQSLQYIRSLVD